MLTAHATALALAVGALIGAGCGEGSKPASTTTAAQTGTSSTVSTTASAEITMATGAPLPRAVWIAKADHICATANAKLSTSVAKSAQDLARLLPQAAIYDHIEAVELSKLVAPTSFAADWTEIVGSVQRFAELSSRAAAYAKSGNTAAGVPVFQAANKVQQEFTTIAQRDGFKECSVP